MVESRCARVRTGASGGTTAGLTHPGGLAALAALGPVAHVRSTAPAKSRCEERPRTTTPRHNHPRPLGPIDPSCGPLRNGFSETTPPLTRTHRRAPGVRGEGAAYRRGASRPSRTEPRCPGGMPSRPRRPRSPLANARRPPRSWASVNIDSTGRTRLAAGGSLRRASRTRATRLRTRSRRRNPRPSSSASTSTTSTATSPPGRRC